MRGVELYQNEGLMLHGACDRVVERMLVTPSSSGHVQAAFLSTALNAGCAVTRADFDSRKHE